MSFDNTASPDRGISASQAVNYEEVHGGTYFQVMSVASASNADNTVTRQGILSDGIGYYMRPDYVLIAENSECHEIKFMFSGSKDEALDDTTPGWVSFGSASYGAEPETRKLDISPIAWTGSECKENFPAIAAGSVTFGGACTDGTLITLISTDTTSKTYECDAGGAANGDVINTDKIAYVRNTDAETQGDNFLAAVNHSNGHDGKIIATDHASAGVVTLTQRDEGAAGNTTITENDGQATAVNFTGGVEGEGSGSVLFVYGESGRIW